MCSLRSSQALLYVSTCWKVLVDYFSDLKKGGHFFANFEMNLPMATVHPLRRCLFFRYFGFVKLRIVLSLSGFASIPHFKVMNPKSLPDLTPNIHFIGLSLGHILLG